MANPASFSVSIRIEWKVKDIFSVAGQESEEFAFKGSVWKLVLHNFKAGDDEKFIRVLLKEVKREKMFDDFTSRACIVDKNYTPQFWSETLFSYVHQHYYNFVIWSVKEKDLTQKEDNLSMDGEISFVCILMPIPPEEDEGNKSVQTSISVTPGGSLETLVLDFRRLLADSALSDVTLKCGEHTIQAHRNILSARSEVFAAMLRNDMVESRSGVIEVIDMDPPILDHLLQFIYSCKLSDMSMDTAPQLYEAADKYGVESLKKDCSAFMKENLTDENACSILLLADAHSDNDLKDCVLPFIVKTNLFLKDDVWLKFCKDHPILAVEVLNRACKTFAVSIFA